MARGGNSVLIYSNKFSDAVSRNWLDGAAQLDRAFPAGDYPRMRWQMLVGDIREFLASGMPARAASEGWTALDLFGCDPDRPYARIDRSGLVLLLKGERIISISADAAVIEARTGQHLTFRRKPDEPGRVLIWDLASEAADPPAIAIASAG